MKAIIVAAGPSTRLMPITNERPKCLLEIGGRTILERAIHALRENGIERIVVVRGYLGHLIDYANVTYFENPDFRENNVLRSLFCAEGEMDDDFVFSYSDILYGPEVVEKLLGRKDDVSLIVDVDWVERYEGRHLHPVSEAELVELREGRVVRIGKKVVSPEKAHGEFIGLARFSRSAADIMREIFHRIAAERPDSPFQQAPCLEKAYLSDMIQELVDKGLAVTSVDIEGGWMEIDTPQDLAEARKAFSVGT